MKLLTNEELDQLSLSGRNDAVLRDALFTQARRANELQAAVDRFARACNLKAAGEANECVDALLALATQPDSALTPRNNTPPHGTVSGAVPEPGASELAREIARSIQLDSSDEPYLAQEIDAAGLADLLAERHRDTNMLASLTARLAESESARINAEKNLAGLLASIERHFNIPITPEQEAKP